MVRIPTMNLKVRSVATATALLAFLADGSAHASDRDDEATADDAFFYRYRPTPMSFEAGVYAGMAWFSSEHNLQDYNVTTVRHSYQQINTSPSIGARIGFFPLAFLGAEVEGGGIIAHTPDGQPATILTLRGAIVAQLPFAHIVPFVYGGGGLMSLDSDSMGKDTDPVTYFGVGIKLAISPYLSFRVDVRDNLMQRNRLLPGVENGDLEHNGELLGSALFTLGRTPAEHTRLPADQDHDGVPDEVDQCPTEPGPPPLGCPVPAESSGDVSDPEDRDRP
jgi:hypothetical protein